MIRLAIITLLTISTQTFAQVPIIYHSDENFKYGLLDSISRMRITEPQFEHIVELNDTLFIVTIENRLNGIIDYEGTLVMDYVDTYLSKLDYNCDTVTLDPRFPLKLQSAPYYFYDTLFNMSHVFYVNLNNECMPSDYYPCPPWTTINLDSATESELIIQKGEKCLFNQDIDSAIIYAKLAIEINPKSASNYFWAANILIRQSFGFHYFNFNDFVNYRNNAKYQEHFDWVIECLNMAEKLENSIAFSFRIQKAKKMFYQHSLINKNEVKKAKKKIKELKRKC